MIDLTKWTFGAFLEPANEAQKVKCTVVTGYGNSPLGDHVEADDAVLEPLAPTRGRLWEVMILRGQGLHSGDFGGGECLVVVKAKLKDAEDVVSKLWRQRPSGLCRVARHPCVVVEESRRRSIMAGGACLPAAVAK